MLDCAHLCACWNRVGAWGKKSRANPALARENAGEEAIDQLAERVFKQADGNHNHVLKRSESATADELLQSGIMNLVETGVLGMPVKNQQGKGRKRQEAAEG